MRQRMPAIILDSVSRTYGNMAVNAVDNVSLSVMAGEFVAVVGTSGSGKSTLLNLIGGIEQPDSGRVRLLDAEPVTRTEWAATRATVVGMVFQAFHLLPTLTALENVIIPLFGQLEGVREKKARGEELLAMVGLQHRAGHRPGELSGGERQRVAIARSLANSPSILLADEPTGNLDSRTAEDILALLRQIHIERGMTLILVTHESRIAAQADRIITLRDGRVDDVGGG